MQLTQYQSQQLNTLLESPPSSNFSGVLSLETTVNSWQEQKSCELVFYNGKIVYGGEKIPDNIKFAKTLGEELNPNLINAALTVASNKLHNPNSVRELIEILIKVRTFTWEQAEAFVRDRVVIVLEKFSLYPGQGKWNTSPEFDLSFGEDRHGLDWQTIKHDLNQRQQQWTFFAPTIPAKNAVPYFEPNSLTTITDRRIREHLQQYVDGQKTLIDIAEAMEKDPLKIAKSYFKWVNTGFVSFEPTVAAKKSNSTSAKHNAREPTSAAENRSNLPTVLSVDDSPIVQISIKRALSDRYNVLLASKATEALNILNQQRVDLLLLDLTMPDIDGLEFCRNIRKVPRFRDLPIIMVTARDGLIDRMKGQIAGTNRYLTKPFQPEELQAIVAKYINARAT